MDICLPRFNAAVTLSVYHFTAYLSFQVNFQNQLLCVYWSNNPFCSVACIMYFSAVLRAPPLIGCFSWAQKRWALTAMILSNYQRGLIRVPGEPSRFPNQNTVSNYLLLQIKVSTYYWEKTLKLWCEIAWNVLDDLCSRRVSVLCIIWPFRGLGGFQASDLSFFQWVLRFWAVTDIAIAR